MRKKVLIVDDDREIMDILGKYLSNHNFSVLSAYNGAEGLAVLEDAKPDIVITDVEMPGMDGFTFCKKLREHRAAASLPVIIMSGKKITETDMVSGYAGGADDYVIKPFSYPVLLAKIQAVLKRAKDAPVIKTAKIKKRGFEIDLEGRALKVAGKPVRVTSKEFDLFSLLASKPGRVISVSHMIENIWGFDPTNYNNPHTVEVHISNLRKKLGPRLSARIKAVAGHGYKFE
ncbi:MAG: response regulator transcription factor [Elusimicrobia bacterium]|nr:response regulator transcription factor [Elusimicrobiota bacterium]